MRSSMRRVLTAAAVLAVALLSLRAAASMEPGLDYFSDASTAIDALARGDWNAFVANQPLMGSFSLLLRAPFVAAVFDSSIETVYFVGALPCLVAALVLGMALGRIAADRGQSPAVQGLVAGLAVINPLTFRALHWGHPEEILTAALCVGAVLLALRDRSLLAGLLLGLAIASKQWAVIAVLPTLMAASEGRLRMLALTALTAAALTLPLLLGDSERFGAVAESAAGQDAGGTWTTPWSLWWPLADVPDGASAAERYLAPQWVGTLSHPLIVLIGLPLAGLLALRRDRRRDDALLLLALLLLLRCMLDTWSNDYYHLPFFLSLLAWEAVRRPGVPVLSLLVAILLGSSFWPHQTQVFAGSLDAAPLLFAGYAAWTIPLAAALAALLYRPDAVARQYHRLRGAPTRPPAVRDRARLGRDREPGRTPA